MIRFGVLNIRTGEIRTFTHNVPDYEHDRYWTVDPRNALVTCAGAGDAELISGALGTFWKLGEWRTLTAEESKALDYDI